MAFSAGWLRDSWYLSDAPKSSNAMPTLSLEADTGGAQDGAPNVLILEPAAVSKLRLISGPAPQTDGLAELRAMLDQREYKGAVEFYQASRYAE